MLLRIITAGALLAAMATPVLAQKGQDSALLANAIAGMRLAPVSRYDYTIATFAAADTQVENGSIYRNVTAFRFLNSTKDEQFFIDSAGMGRVIARERTAYYHDWASTGELASAREQLSGTAGALETMDSLLFRDYRIAGVQRKGSIVVYRLAFPQGHLIADMTIEVEPKRKQLAAIRYRFQRPVAGLTGTAGPESILQVVTMSDFRFGEAGSVPEVLTAGSSLPERLHRYYPQFQIKKL